MKNISKFIALIALATIFTFLYIIKNEQDSIFHNRLIMDSLVEDGGGLIKDDVQTGLDEKLPFASRYYFKGKEVNNYFKSGDLCFRIVNITSDNHIKIVYEGSSKNGCNNISKDAVKMAFDNENNVFATSDLYNSLKESDKFKSILEKSVDANWYIGQIKMSGNQLSENIQYERGNVEKDFIVSKIGLVSITDYLKAGCAKSVYDAIETCGDDNYLFNDTNYWTLNSVLWDKTNIYTVTDGMPKPKLYNNSQYYVYPSFYLKSGLLVSGKGTMESPYVLK